MSLRELNINKIERYGYKKFIYELEAVSNVLTISDELRLNYIITYYKLLKYTDIEMKRDVISLKDLIASNLKMLQRINAALKRPVLDFLINLITYNVNYVKDVRRLA